VIFNCFKLFIKAFKYNKQKKGEIKMKYEAPKATFVSFIDNVSAWTVYAGNGWQSGSSLSDLAYLLSIGYSFRDNNG
jgi:hypothetical protein